MVFSLCVLQNPLEWRTSALDPGFKSGIALAAAAGPPREATAGGRGAIHGKNARVRPPRHPQPNSRPPSD